MLHTDEKRDPESESLRCHQIPKHLAYTLQYRQSCIDLPNE